MKKIRKLGVLPCAFLIMFFIFPVTGCSHGDGGSGGSVVVEKSGTLRQMTSYLKSITKSGTYYITIIDGGEDEETAMDMLLDLMWLDCFYDENFSMIVDISALNITKLDKTIGYTSYVFGCTSLISIVLPESLTEIGIHIFSNCTSLTSVTLPSNLIYIDEDAFGHCTSLTSIIIPSNVTYIGDIAFDACTSLSSVTFSENSSLEEIGQEAFRDCTSLKSFTIPESVTKIGAYVFLGCTSLISVVFEDPSGWKNEKYENDQNNEIPEDELRNSSTAAEYLTSIDHNGWPWTKSEE